MSKGASIWEINERLGLAMEAGDIEAARQALREGARPEMPMRRGIRALYWAVGKEHEALVREMLEAGASVEERHRGTAESALHLAAREGSESMIDLLMEAGADLRAKDGQGRGVLHAAVERDGKNAARLIALGARVDKPDDSGMTPLMLASWRGCRKGVEELLKAGASLRARCHRGRGALHYATFGWDPEPLRMLLEAGADPLEKDKEGISALERARREGLEEGVEMIRAHLARKEAQELDKEARQEKRSPRKESRL